MGESVDRIINGINDGFSELDLAPGDLITPERRIIIEEEAWSDLQVDIDLGLMTPEVAAEVYLSWHADFFGIPDDAGNGHLSTFPQP